MTELQSMFWEELLPLFWTAIGRLEETGLKVIASTSEKID